MGRATTDDRTQGDNRIIIIGFCNALDGQRHFISPRNTHNGDIRIGNAVTTQGVQCTLNQAFHNKAVKTAHDQRITSAALGKITFNYSDICH